MAQNSESKGFKGLSPSNILLVAQNIQPEKCSFVNPEMSL